MSCERAGSRVVSVATESAGHDAHYAAPWFVLASGGFGSGAIELDSRWATHERLLGLPLRGLPGAGRAPVRRRLPGRAADGASRGRGRRGAAGRGGGERARGGCRPCRGDAVARGVGRGDRAGQRLACRPGRSLVALRIARGSGGMSEHGVLEELMRGSLDHCVKCTICETQCPVSNVSPLFPGPKYAGPQAERYRDRRRAIGRRVGRLLLGLRDLLDVLPAGGEDRRDQLAGAQQAQAARRASRSAIGSSRARPGSVERAPRWRRWPTSRSVSVRSAILGAEALGIHRDAAAPKFAGRRFSRWFKEHPSPATGRKILYFHGCGTEYYEPWEGEKVVAILEHNGFEVIVPKQDCCGLPLQSSGLFDDARKVVLRRGREFAPLPAPGPEPARRRQRHELHADAQARGARDPLARGRPRL